jgi:hypothetical protein
MHLVRKEFHAFLIDNASKYPYNDVRLTRKKVYTKWLISNRKTRLGEVPRLLPTHHAIPSSTLDEGTVQALIVTKEMYPATAVMCEVLDWMECWGRRKDPLWYTQIVNWFYFLLSHHIQLADRTLLKDCIQYRVRHICYESIESLTATHLSSLIANWQDYFDAEYHEYSHRFFDLAVGSSKYIKIKCEQHQTSAMTPADSEATAPASAPAIIESSP